MNITHRTATALVLLSISLLISGCCSDDPAAPCTPPSIITTDSGLQYLDMEPGSGPPSEAGDSITVHFETWLADGTQIESSRDRNDPFTFQLDVGMVIAGFDEGTTGMKVGGKRKLFIPPHLAYGENGAGPTIPPNAWLTFIVEVIEIEEE